MNRHNAVAAASAIILITALLAPISATAMSYWHGPGANPCDDQCSTEWALDEVADAVPAEALAQWRQNLQEGRAMRPLAVRDGDAIKAMGEGGPHMIIKPMAARLDRWEPGSGWTTRVDGNVWIFMIVDACQNPTVIMRPASKTPVATPNPSPMIEQALWWNDTDPRHQHSDWTPRQQHHDVPEPATFWLFFVLALAAALLKRHGRRFTP